ncbi:nuclear transport factor 2 family protein [Mycobacterium marseillense]|uniref:Nuclear transport factor 2 family protein n=1 Tax=Mycobacterium marseillense TaxID=701042 RepID=A0AAD0DWK1_9MYCO|nr:nuclear transport factor 2 family protein [Mycobacterium marseillense]ASW92897.1 nuclear transport factor 2 family protein [Mycobacterium marseillense]MCA2262442.1 nuclear transport factor 2 family protein [Mycobacterium marseillense]MCV7404378.1 nuclear transport factor 2 family protein [Mycobacterium marseillense]ORA95179.1 polyketide cyclase [Mycobacterium marseillense]
MDRLESSVAISQLPSRYAMALDARDLGELVALFVDDVDAGAEGRGRDALRRWYDRVLRRFYRSIHLICGHQFDFVDADHAIGSVYCRAEHEDGDGWFVITMLYDDVYERRDGQWYFVKRREHPWYSVDVTERPGPEFMRWPADITLRAAMPHRMPTWRSFWADGDAALPGHLSARP